jgi:hypothetical protein
MHVKFWSGNVNDTDQLKYVIVMVMVEEKVKVKFILKPTMEVHRGSRGKALHFI